MSKLLDKLEREVEKRIEGRIGPLAKKLDEVIMEQKETNKLLKQILVALSERKEKR